MLFPFNSLVRILIAFLLAGLVVYSCGGGGGGDGSPQFHIDQSALPVAAAGQPYQANLSASGGQGPYTWQVANQDLPAGLKFNAATGRIEGSTTQIGSFNVPVMVIDSANAQSQANLRLVVIEADAALASSGTRDASQNAGTTTEPGPGVTAQAMAPLSGLVDVLRAMPEKTWVQASLNKFADVWTPEELRPMDVNGLGVPPPSKIIAAWSGFAWDSNRGDLILYGGGHANYPGNDIYRWHGSNRTWERASLPSDIIIDASGNFTALDGPDAAPASAHTYDNNIFLPVVDRLLVFGGAAYNNGGPYRRATGSGQSRNTGPYLWDPNKANPNKVGGTTGSHVKRVSPHPEIVGGQMWQNRDMALNLATNPSLPNSHLEGCTGYAVEGGKDVVYAGARLGSGTATQLFRYVINDVNNPKVDSWTQLGGYWSSPQGQTVCTFDPVQKIFVKVGNATTPFTYWDVTAPGGNSNYEKIIQYSEPTGEFASKLANGQIDIRYCGLDFDPTRRQYAIWCGGSDVWMLIPPSTVAASGWSLQKQAVGGSSLPAAGTGTGILGKWKYIPNLDAFMALQDTTAGNIWIYKPAGWVAPGGGGGQPNQPPTVSWVSPTNGQQFSAGQVISLQANATDVDGVVTAVDFLDGSNLLAHVAPAPWRFDWSGAAIGSHVLSAIAYDNLSASGTSTPVNIQVVQASGNVLVLQDGQTGYTGTRDTYLSRAAAGSNYGTAASLIDSSNYYAMMLRFAIFNREGGPVPNNAIIQSAQLELYKSSFYSSTLSAYRLRCDWLEIQANWTACRNGVPWVMAGALGAGTDYVAQADGSGTGAWDPGWVSIDVTKGLLAMQAGEPNFGWRLRRTAGDDINTKRYITREYAAVVGQRPKLTVRYSVS